MFDNQVDQIVDRFLARRNGLPTLIDKRRVQYELIQLADNGEQWRATSQLWRKSKVAGV
jgi:hypothetical protein